MTLDNLDLAYLFGCLTGFGIGLIVSFIFLTLPLHVLHKTYITYLKSRLKERNNV